MKNLLQQSLGLTLTLALLFLAHLSFAQQRPLELPENVNSSLSLAELDIDPSLDIRTLMMPPPIEIEESVRTSQDHGASRSACPNYHNYLYSQDDVDALGASGCTAIGGVLYINDSASINKITDLSPLSNFDSIGVGIIIEKTTELKNLDGISGLTSAGFSIYILDNSGLENVDGLRNIPSLDWVLVMRRNSSLRSACGIYQLLCADPPICSIDAVEQRILIGNNAPGTNSVAEIIANGPLATSSISNATASDPYNCDPDAGTYSRDLMISYTSTAPMSGNITIQLSNPTRTFSTPIDNSSSQTISLTGLPINGEMEDVSIELEVGICNTTFPYEVAGLFTNLSNPVTNVTAGDPENCDPISGTYSRDIQVFYEGTDWTGDMEVSVDGNVLTVPISNSSPQTIVLTDLPVDGQTVNVTINFPGICAPYPATFVNISVIQGLTAGDPYDCDPITDTYSRDLMVMYPGGGLSGNILVELNNDGNILSFPITNEYPQALTLTGLPSNGANVDVSVDFDGSIGCGGSVDSVALFTNPQNCSGPHEDCDITALTAGTQTCNENGLTYNQELILTYSDAPETGTILVKVNDGAWLSFPIGTSPQSLVLEGLDPNGQSVDIFIKFSDDNSCTIGEDNLFTAPEDCTPPPACEMSALSVGTQSCNDDEVTYDQVISVSYENAPETGSILVQVNNGGWTSYPIGSSPQSLLIEDLPADGQGVDITVKFSADEACSISQENLFTAPDDCSTTPPPSGAGDVLFVVANAGGLNSGDAAVKARIEGLGHTVHLISDENTQISSADGKSLVIISNSVSSGQVGSKFTNSDVPVLVYETYLFDDLGMTSGSGFGNDNGETQVVVQNSGHPMAGGLSGFTTVLNSSGQLAYGYPNGNAVVVASTDGNSSQATIFSYETGVGMVNGNAPARRVGIFLKDSEVPNLTAEGWTFFDAAVCWAMDCGSARQGRLSKSTNVSFYPNPFNDMLNIQWDGNKTSATLHIMNSLGQAVYKTQLELRNEHQLSLPALPKGIYFVEIIGEGFRAVEQLVKQE